METGFVFALIPISAVAILAFFVIGFNNDAKHGGRGKGLLSGFSYSVSVAMLAILVGSGIIALNIALKSSVFPNADQGGYRFSSPPPLFLSGTVADPSKSVAPINCTENCIITESDRQTVDQWEKDFKNWQAGSNSPWVQYRSELITALSFFLVALPLFILFFRWVQHEAKRQQAIPGLRSFYFYGIAVVGLLMTVASGAFLINSGLRRALGAGDSNTPFSIPGPIYSTGDPTLTSVNFLIDCQAKCGFSDETIGLARDWRETATKPFNQGNYSSIQRDLASALPTFIFGLPLFLYHFIIIRRETRKDDPTPPPGAIA